MSESVLLVEDEEVLRNTLEDVLKKAGHAVFACRSLRDAEDVLRREVIDAVLLDLRLPDGDGSELFRRVRAIDAGVPVIMMTAYPETRAAVQAMKEGAFEYVAKPFELTDVKASVAKACELARLRSEVSRLRRDAAGELVGTSPAAQKLSQLVERVAASRDTPVLITGESGAGKEVVAQRLHRLSPRRDGPIVCLNCSSIPDALFEAELLGYEKGAYTGAVGGKKGLFEIADGGTLFLDEVVELPLALQPKLLRLLERSPFRRVGGVRDLTADVRVVAATNSDLRQSVRAGRFREDLFFRLAVVDIQVPPLRDRIDDVPALANHMLRQLAQAMARPAGHIGAEAMAALVAYRWPGNVRELRNVIERALILRNGDEIRPVDLPGEVTQALDEPSAGVPLDGEDVTLASARKRHVLQVLSQCGGNRSETARKLAISRSTLKELLKAWGVAEARED
jgi:two-component system response regulator AtoC